MIGPTYMKVNFQTPMSRLEEMIRRGETKGMPACFNLLGNVEVVINYWVSDKRTMGDLTPRLELPPADISMVEKADKIIGYIDDAHGKEYFGRFVMDLPLTYYEFAKRDAKNYSILYHEDQFHEALDKHRRDDDIVSRWLNRDTNYKFAWAYPGNKSRWYKLINLPRHQRVYAFNPKIPYADRNTIDPWEARVEILRFPYEPKPFYCFGCKKEHVDGFDVVLSKNVDNTRNFGGISYQYDGSHFSAIKNAKILFLTQFCGACFSAFRMLGFMTPEKD